MEARAHTVHAIALNHDAAVTGVLILLVTGLLVLLLRQTKISMERARALDLGTKRFRKTVEASLNAVVIADREGRIVHVNRAAETTFRCCAHATIGAPLGSLIVPVADASTPSGDQALGPGDTANGWLAAISDSGRTQTQALRTDGTSFPVELSVCVVDGPDGHCIIAFARDITDDVVAQRELTKARDEARAAIRAKSDFLAIMSHEMRTPLNGVMAVLDLLRDTNLDAIHRRYVDTALRSAELLQRHVDDVLDIHRFEAGQLSLSPEPTNLRELVNDVSRINAQAAADRCNVITTRFGLTTDTVTVDRQRLGQILVNLVGNAVKFTEGGTIEVTVTPCPAPDAPERAEISVSDTGIGIDADDQARIFDDFVTLDPSYQRAAGGYGLGLGMCRRIAEAMGGTIGVESAPGRGSRFWLRLRLPAAHDHAVGSRAATPAPGKASNAMAHVPHAALASLIPEVEHVLRVLVVEDNETNRFAAREMLRRHGCSVTEAPDGLRGVDLAVSQRFDLVLMDISMPHLDGLEATRRIRAERGPGDDLPIVALTAHALAGERESILRAGMQDLLIKPLRQAHVIELVGRLRRGGLGLRTMDTRPARDPADRDRPCCPIKPRLDRADVLETGVLAEFADILGAPAFRHRLETFRAEMRALAGDVTGLHALGSLEEVRARAHAANGSASLFGAVRLQDVLGTLEDACIDNEAEFIDPLIAEVENAIEDTERALADAARDGTIPDADLTEVAFHPVSGETR